MKLTGIEQPPFNGDITLNWGDKDAGKIISSPKGAYITQWTRARLKFSQPPDLKREPGLKTAEVFKRLRAVTIGIKPV